MSSRPGEPPQPDYAENDPDAIYDPSLATPYQLSDIRLRFHLEASPWMPNYCVVCQFHGKKCPRYYRYPDLLQHCRMMVAESGEEEEGVFTHAMCAQKLSEHMAQIRQGGMDPNRYYEPEPVRKYAPEPVVLKKKKKKPRKGSKSTLKATKEPGQLTLKAMVTRATKATKLTDQTLEAPPKELDACDALEESVMDYTRLPHAHYSSILDRYRLRLVPWLPGYCTICIANGHLSDRITRYPDLLQHCRDMTDESECYFTHALMAVRIETYMDQCGREIEGIRDQCGREVEGIRDSDKQEESEAPMTLLEANAMMSDKRRRKLSLDDSPDPKIVNALERCCRRDDCPSDCGCPASAILRQASARKIDLGELCLGIW